MASTWEKPLNFVCPLIRNGDGCAESCMSSTFSIGQRRLKKAKEGDSRKAGKPVNFVYSPKAKISRDRDNR